MAFVIKKISPNYFMDVASNRKNFELRKDEDNIKVGDFLALMEWDGVNYTGSYLVRRVLYVLRDVPEYGLMDGYVIIGW